MSNSAIKSTFKKLQEFNRNPEGIKFREQHLKSYLIAISVIAVLIVSSINIYDLLAEIQPSAKITLFRILFSLLFLVNLIAALFFKRYRNFLYSSFYVFAFYLTLAAYFTGEIEHYTLIGLNSVLIIWFCLVPFNYKSLILHGSLFIIQYYLLLNIIQLPTVSIFGNSDTNIFILFTLIAGSCIAFLNNINAASAFYKSKELGRLEEHDNIK